MDELTKVCSKCGVAKSLDSFAPRSGAMDGRRGVCRECKRNGHKAWRDANREHVREKGREVMKRLYALNPEKFRSRSNKFYEEHRDICIARHKDWVSRNRDRVLNYAKAYRLAHLADCIAALRAWRLANPDAGKRHKANQRNELTDSYVKRVLFNSQSSSPEVPRWLIDLKREQLKLSRVTKQLKQEIINVQEK